MNNVLKVLFLGLSLAMVYLVIVTSMASNLFQLPAVVVNEPWFKTTLVDFYFNITIFSVWVVYKEAQWLRSLLWILAFILLGSIATCFYVFLQFVTIKKEEGLEAVLLRRK